MQIGVLGLNHKSAHLELREKLARCSVKRFGAHCSLHGALPYVLLTTCNRTEIYFSSDDLAATHSYFLGILRNEIAEEFEHTIYSYFGADCFSHLAKVTAGMDSAILGETEIQGQVKQAYELAATYRPLCRELHYLFQKCLKVGKEMRTSPLMPSLEETIFSLATSHLGNLTEKKILFVGISEINLKIIKLLKLNNLRKITLCNRTHSRAHTIAKELGCQVLPWNGAIFDYDLIIYGTKAPHYLLTEATAARSKKLVIDLSVPRNVDPEISRSPGITLLNIDEINRSIDVRKKLRAKFLLRLKTPLLEEAVHRQIHLYRKKEAYLKVC